MATIGMDKLYYAKLLSDPKGGTPTYDTPKWISPAVSANINPTVASGDLAGDDHTVVHIDRMTALALTIAATDLPTAVEADLLGKTVDANGVLSTVAGNKPPKVAIGFRSENAEGGYTYYWLYKGVFQEYQRQPQTQDNNVSFQSPSIQGTFMARDSDGKYFDKANDTDDSISTDVITHWFDAVYNNPAVTAATGVTLDAATFSLAVGATKTLVPTVSPEDASNKNVKWSSSDPTIATVDQSGKVTAVKAGSVAIICELTADPTKQAVSIGTITAASGG